MQLVIDIPEGTYKAICETKDLWETEPKNIIYASIANGTPLPKGHGRLFDERDIVNGNYEIIGNKIYEVEPIIEADTVEIESQKSEDKE